MSSKGGSRRPDQVSEAIRGVLAEALLRGEVRDPRVGLVTVSRVDVNRDMSVAQVWVVPHGENDAERDSAVEGLRSAAGYLRGFVARELTTRSVPELRFERDRGLEHAQRIDALLAGLKTEEPPEEP
jgi:ribosome-binding factor A